MTSIPALFLYEPLLKHTNYIFGSGAHTGIALGATSRCSPRFRYRHRGRAVPDLKRQSQSISLGYVASRTLESTIIIVGVVSVLSVVTLRHDIGGAGAANAASLVLVERALVAIHDWTFLLGPGFCAGFGNGVLLGYLMYKSGLVPRGMAMLGLIGGPLIFVSGIAIMFGAYKNGSPAAICWHFPKSPGRRRSASTSSSRGSSHPPYSPPAGVSTRRRGTAGHAARSRLEAVRLQATQAQGTDYAIRLNRQGVGT